MENKETFKITYSAKQQNEIKAIREKYTVKEHTEDKMELLRRLDRSVTDKAAIVALAFGIVGALLLGIGMSLVMTDIGVVLGLGTALSMMVGIAVGLVGIAAVSVAYPMYGCVLRAERERVAPEILRLTDELLKNG